MGVVNAEIDGPVCRLRLNRPDKLNALNGAIHTELHAQLERLAELPDVAVMVLSGEGRAFSAGADLGALAPGSAPSWTKRRHAMGSWQRLLDLLERIPQVTVASIHGHCVGGAALLAVACDIRIGADDLRVQIPELALGIPLTWAGVPRLAREVGLPTARDMVMTGRVLDADAAQSCGFVQRLVPASDLARATDELVDELVAMPAGPLAITRSMFSAISRDRLGAVAWADADILGWSGREAESQAAAAAYVQGRSNRTTS
ncbi:MAG: enoyl-CoA hydratase/isomerase family protein [Acidimicrobiales bacterium]